MIPLETLLVFFVAALGLAVAPGPDNIFVLTQSALQGRAAGLLVTLGLCTGLLVHTTAVALGVAAIFQTSAVAFTALKMVGACYLLYLAWHAFRATSANITNSERPALSGRRLYTRGIVMNVTNPKVTLFFLAILPSSADPERGSLTLQLMTLGGVFIVATLIVFGSVALLAGLIGDWLKGEPRAQRVMNCVAGTVFVALALTLATAGR